MPAAWSSVGDPRGDPDFDSEVLPIPFGQISDPVNLGKFEFIRLVPACRAPVSGPGPPSSERAVPPAFQRDRGRRRGRAPRWGGPIPHNLDHATRSPRPRRRPRLARGRCRRASAGGECTQEHRRAASIETILRALRRLQREIKRPVLTLQAVIDEIIPVTHESAWRDTVTAAGKSDRSRRTTRAASATATSTTHKAWPRCTRSISGSTRASRQPTPHSRPASYPTSAPAWPQP